MVLLFVLVWTPPTGGAPLVVPSNLWIFFYFLIIIALFEFLYTLVSVPYISLFPEMFEDLKERSEVSIYRQVAAMVGVIIAFAVMPLLVDALAGRFGEFGGWTGAGAILGFGAGGPFLFLCLEAGNEGSSAWKRRYPSLHHSGSLLPTGPFSHLRLPA